MNFNRFVDDPYLAFQNLRHKLCLQTIFYAFAHYVPNSDIEKYITHMYATIKEYPVYDIPPIDKFKKLQNIFTYSELLNGIETYFSKSELALFVEYLITSYDVD